VPTASLAKTLDQAPLRAICLAASIDVTPDLVDGIVRAARSTRMRAGVQAFNGASADAASRARSVPWRTRGSLCFRST
jgi:hypothetical protein